MPLASIRLAMAVLPIVVVACAPEASTPAPHVQALKLSGESQVPAAAPPVLPHDTFTLVSKALGGEVRRINVYTPPGYDAGTRCPILYMPDGGVDEDFPHVVATVEAAVRAGEMRPVIVVGIENTERRRDMTGPTDVASDKQIAPRVGGSANFRAFIRDELMPAVDARVRGDGERAIIGESLAGLFIVETCFAEPEMFQTYIALSPSLWWNDQAIVRGAGGWQKMQPRSRATLFLSVAGDDDRNGAIDALAAALVAAPPPWLTSIYAPLRTARHDTIYRASEQRVLRRLFPPVPPIKGATNAGGR